MDNGLVVMRIEDITKISDDDIKKVLSSLPDAPCYLNCGACGYRSCRDALKNGASCVCSVSVKIDEKRIPLNTFLQKLIKNVIIGITKSLKGADGEKVEIRVEK